ncbi:hypothetical protein NLI96_g1545 [Meripilus lineatus]|uniref:Uncharacterized protein n=1 Tax=Meripilus lineatus TaxID=2056292 RepID=A0AAD5VAF2_9APHY|nr:hypothetical protein NLI96_g1545 [Physisporinus lineatus]
MSTAVDFSAELGEYMLSGWVLTDNVCSKCGKVPLMRSPSGPILYFCANCDGSPSRASQHGPQPSQSAASSHRTATIPSPRSGSSYDSSSHGASRPSTPPTELYSQLSFDAEDTEEILRRREQSDHASTEIGKLLLKGWTMLADECPNSQCYGIPLVRPPKGDKDPRKECVICHGVYVEQVDSNGSSNLVPLENQTSPSSDSQAIETINAFPSPPVNKSTSSIKSIKGKVAEKRPTGHTKNHSQATSTPNPSSGHQPGPTLGHSSVATLEDSADALEMSLQALTEKLRFLTKGSNIDATYIGQTADAISRVSQALMQVKQLRWNESRAYA